MAHFEALPKDMIAADEVKAVLQETLTLLERLFI